MPLREGTVIIGARIPFVFPYGPGRKQARALVEELARGPSIQVLGVNPGGGTREDMPEQYLVSLEESDLLETRG